MIKTIKIETPLGVMIAGATDEGVCLLEFSDRKMLATEYKDLTRLLKTSLEDGENKHLKIIRRHRISTGCMEGAVEYFLWIHQVVPGTGCCFE
jgi:hypothetical protein